jgi:hypothetical protein
MANKTGKFVIIFMVMTLILGASLAACAQKPASVEQPSAPAATSTPAATPTAFEAKTYTNSQYGFSIQYPKEWEPRSELVNNIVVAAFGIPAFVPGISISVADANAPVTADWIVAQTNSLPDTSKGNVTSGPTPTTLDDGSPAYQYALKYNYQAFEIMAFGIAADKNGKRIRAFVWTIDTASPYNEKLASDIVHTLSLKPASGQQPAAPAPTPTPTATPVSSPTPTPTSTPTPSGAKQLSFEAKTYTNSQYGFSVQYPKEWESKPELITKVKVAVFSIPAYMPGMDVTVADADAPLTADWIVKLCNSLPDNVDGKVTSGPTPTTLDDGSPAFEYEFKYTYQAYGLKAFGVAADKNGKRILAYVWTIDSMVPYDKAKFSEIAHTLSIK